MLKSQIYFLWIYFIIVQSKKEDYRIFFYLLYGLASKTYFYQFKLGALFLPGINRSYFNSLLITY